MNILRRDDIEKLMGSYEGSCVSVFMPTHRGVAESQQDQIRFKNLLREAEESLLQSGLRTPQVNDLLKPVQMLLKDASFRRQKEMQLKSTENLQAREKHPAVSEK